VVEETTLGVKESRENFTMYILYPRSLLLHSAPIDFMSFIRITYFWRFIREITMLLQLGAYNATFHLFQVLFVPK
jgi:hypothetical protein